MSPDARNEERGTAPLATDTERTPSPAEPASGAEGGSVTRAAAAPEGAVTCPRGAANRATGPSRPADDDAPEPPAAEAAEAAETAEADEAAEATGAPEQPAAEATGVPEGAGASEVAEAVEAAAEQAVRDAISVPDGEGRARRRTRRFPLFTRDTARPEGGGRAAPGDAPAPARQWPILTVLGIAALGLLVTALDQFRAGTLLIGTALLAGAVLRWALPGVGMLAVRSRFTDIVTYGVLGGAIVLLAMMAQPNPWLEIPFLKDTLHFTLND